MSSNTAKTISPKSFFIPGETKKIVTRTLVYLSGDNSYIQSVFLGPPVHVILQRP